MLEDALRIGAAIVCETLALVVWNIGSRSPRALWRDARAAASSLRALSGTLVVALLGAIFFLTAIVLLVPILAGARTISPVLIGGLFVALLVEFLIGNDVRALVIVRREP